MLVQVERLDIIHTLCSVLGQVGRLDIMYVRTYVYYIIILTVYTQGCMHSPGEYTQSVMVKFDGKFFPYKTVDPFTLANMSAPL